MSEIMMLCEAEPRKILQTVIEKKIPAIMSYLSRGKWHVAKVLLTELGANRLNVEAVTGPHLRGDPQRKIRCWGPRNIANGNLTPSCGFEPCDKLQNENSVSPRKSRAPRQHPINIQIEQPVGVSVKYGYGKFIFDTTVVGFESAPNPESGGVILLAVPDQIELVQRRSYFRVNVPESLKVNVVLWHRCVGETWHTNNDRQVPLERYWQGRLVDISAGGAQIAVDTAQEPDFRKGQFIGLRFTPLPYETLLMFDAQIRDILPTADDKNICLGLQMVGLEASSEGREVLSRLVEVVERYYQMSQSSVRQQDFQHSAQCKV